MGLLDLFRRKDVIPPGAAMNHDPYPPCYNPYAANPCQNKNPYPYTATAPHYGQGQQFINPHGIFQNFANPQNKKATLGEKFNRVHDFVARLRPSNRRAQLALP